jgi:uncharacterized repeat protein (TIGR02543 family)
MREATHETFNYAMVFAYVSSSILNEIWLPVDNTYYTPYDIFHMTYSVEKIHLPASITSLAGEECLAPFSYTPVKELYIDAPEPPAYSADLWHSFEGNAMIYVPEGLKSVYEAQLWEEGGNCVWTYKSPDEDGEALNNIIEERPKVTFHTDGGSRPLYTYTPATEDGTYYWYVNAGTSAYSNNFPIGETPLSEKTGYSFTGWFTDEDLTQSYEATTAVNLGEGGLDLYAGWEAQVPTGISKASAKGKAEVKGYYSIIGEKLPQAPGQGIYIILYNDGSAEKIVKK